MSRASILQAVKAANAGRDPLPMPDVALASLKQVSPAPALEDFTATLELLGARVHHGDSMADVGLWLEKELPVGARVASVVADISGNVDLASIHDPHGLDGVHTAVLQAEFGVCENGAVWLSESRLGPHRVLPFIAEHLVILLKRSDLVATFHQAYELIGQLQGGFGLFLAGPSKTADIEQCLVIGAHGARSATVFLVG